MYLSSTIILKGMILMNKIISSFMVFSLVFFTLVSNGGVHAYNEVITNEYVDNNHSLKNEEGNHNYNLISIDEAELEYSTYALPLAAPIISMILKKMVKEAVKEYGKQVVIDAVMQELNLPKTISGKKLIGKLEKVGFEKLRQNGSHVTMKGPNGKTFTVPLHDELKTGTYNSIKKSIKDSIAP